MMRFGHALKTDIKTVPFLEGRCFYNNGTADRAPRIHLVRCGTRTKKWSGLHPRLTAAVDELPRAGNSR